MTTTINGSSPSVTFSDGTTQSTAGLPLTGGTINSAASTAPLIASINGTEAMRVDGSGNLLVGTTGALQASNYPMIQVMNGTTYGQYIARSTTSSSGKYWHFGASANAFIIYNQGDVGQYMVDGATSWSANSDERLKTQLTSFTDAVKKVSSLRSGTGRYLTDDESVSRSFLIAQDVQAVLPEAVDIQNDEQKTLGLRYTDVIPLLVASIQELNVTVTAQAATIATLQAQVTALNTKVGI